MKILNFTNMIGTGVRKGAMLTFMLLLGVAVNCFSQSTEYVGEECTMVCSGELITPVDQETCESTISYKNLLTSPCFEDGYKVEIRTLNNHLIEEGNSSVTVSLVGRYIYKVTHDINGEDVSCWGYITFEDKKGPVKNLQYDAEPLTTVCGTENSVDPSGEDDLKSEFVSCVVLEDYGKAGIEPWFDKLDVNDFEDCTGVEEVYSFDNKYDVCEDEILSDPMQIEMAYMMPKVPAGWEPCTIFTRSWFAADVTGRLSDTCTQLVIVLRPKARRIKIDDHVTAECGDDINEVIENGYPYFRDLNNNIDFLTCPATAGKKVRLSPNEHYCKYAVSVHVGEKTPLCNTDGSKVFKLKSKWTIMDWCEGGLIYGNEGEDLFDDYSSTLEVKDTKVPVANGQPEFVANTALFDCTADVVVAPQQFDDCVGVEYYETTAEYIVDGDDPHLTRFERFTVPTNGITLTDVPLNVVIYVTYTATDFCGNIGKAYNEIFVEDDRAPVCIANDELNVGMVRLSEDPNDVGARVYGEDLDDSSRDNCFSLILEVRRADQAAASNDPDTLWAEYVEFSKEDLTIGGCKGEYKVELRVTEDRGQEAELMVSSIEGNYYYPSALSSTCWSTVILEDKNPPVLTIDEAKIAKCTEPMPEFDELGIEGCYDGITTQIDTLYDNDCDYYEVLRIKKTWRPYRDHDGVKQFIGTASQDIIIENVHDSKFTFPMDVKIDCSMATIPAPTTIDGILDEEGCANWLMEVEDTEYESNDPDACRKILRKYTFINWCTWDPSNTELAVVRRPQAGVWSADQQVVIHYQDANHDKINDVDDADDGDLYDIEVSEHGYTSDGAWVQIDNGNKVQNEHVYQHGDDIRGEEVSSVDAYNYGYFSYIQVIKIQDGEKPVAADPIVKQFCDPLNTDCDFPTNVEITLGGSDNCSDLFFSSYIQPFQKGDFIHDSYGVLEGNVLTGFYPVGTHNLLIKTADACGNAVEQTIELVVQPECKKPTPICYATYTAAMEDGSVTVWASDIESGSSSDNCSDYSDLTFTLELLYDRNNNDTINLDDVSANAPADTSIQLTCENIGTSFIALWATDEAGNEQFCVVPITVTDNQGVCANQEAKVSGAIVNEDDEEIDNVVVKISAPGVNTFAQIFNGVFDFLSIPMHKDVTVTAEKNQGHLNGVSTSDLVLLQRHILGVTSLNSPYKLIAADANRDEKVDTRDLLHVSRLILGIYDELPSNTSWRFVDKNHTFVNPTSPWGFPESTTFNNLDSDVQANFIGIKIGDISGNARPSNLLGDDDVIATGTVSFAADNVELKAGEEQTVMLSADDMTEVSGYQFTIQLKEGTVFNGLTFGEDSDLTEANFGLTRVDQNMITVSWATTDAMNFDRGTELFGLKLIAPSTTTVQNVLSFNSGFTPAEAYDNDLNPLDVVLNIISASNEFELYQNAPNPVSNETMIGFNLPEAGKAQLSIMDVSGKVLRRVEGSFTKGYNQITLNRDELGSAGVLYYQLDTDQGSASKKMIIID